MSLLYLVSNIIHLNFVKINKIPQNQHIWMDTTATNSDKFKQMTRRTAKLQNEKLKLTSENTDLCTPLKETTVFEFGPRRKLEFTDQ